MSDLPAIRKFLGRRKELKWFKQNLINNERILSITGICGIGKTTLISKLTSIIKNEGYQIESDSKSLKFKGILYEDCTYGIILEEIIFDLVCKILSSNDCPKYFIDMWSNQSTPLENKFNFTNNLTEDKNYLIILDNLESILENNKFKNKDLATFLKWIMEKEHNFYIILAGRHTPIIPTSKHIISESIKGLDKDSASKILEQCEIKIKPQLADLIIEKTEGNPRALEFFNIIFNENPHTAEDLIKEKRLLDGTYEEIECRLLEEIYDNLDKIEKQLLKTLSIIRIPLFYKAIEKISGISEVKILTTLHQRSLIERTDDGRKYYLHSLVKDFAYRKIEDIKIMHLKAIIYFLNNIETEGKTKEDIQANLEAEYHLFAIEEYQKAFHTFKGCYKLLKRQGHWQEILEALEKYDNKLREKRDIALFYGHKASILKDLGNYDKALEYYEKSEKIILAGSDKANLGAIYNNTGEIHRNKGNYDKALEYYKKSEEITLAVGDKAGLGITYNNIGLIYDNKGDYDKALEYYKKDLEITLAVGDKAGLAPTYNNIGGIYDSKGDYDKALEYYEKDLEITLAVGDKAGLGIIYSNIGGIYRSKGDYDKALEYYKKSEEIILAVGNKAGLGTTYNNIGTIYNSKGEYDKALEYYKMSEKICKEIGNKADLGPIYNNIGTTYENKGEYDKALEYYKMSEKICKEIGDKAGLGSTYSNISVLYIQIGELEKALKFINEAISIQEKIGRHPKLKVHKQWQALLERMRADSFSKEKIVKWISRFKS